MDSRHSENAIHRVHKEHQIRTCTHFDVTCYIKVQKDFGGESRAKADIAHGFVRAITQRSNECPLENVLEKV